MVHETSNGHIQAVMNNLTFIILDCLAAKRSGILNSRRDFCDWSVSSHSIWKVMPFRHFPSTIHSVTGAQPGRGHLGVCPHEIF